mmetsp:Transcript_9077/g.22626  ORF Transcript_9077/g.22626 Transcript_9077/m.22626 type:complete len:122 (-) Transcript_9077:33-398(-)
MSDNAPPSVASLESKLNAALEPSHLDVEDVSGGCGMSFKIIVVSAQFDGVGLLDRQRMIHDAIGYATRSLLNFSPNGFFSKPKHLFTYPPVTDPPRPKDMGIIHALELKCKTPAQWAKTNP